MRFTTPLIAAAVAAVVIALLVVLGKVPLRYTLRNLTVRWRTTFMTSLAFTLVVALFTVLLGFVNGMYCLTDGSGQVGNLIVLSGGATDELFSNLPAADLGDIENQKGIEREGDRPMSSRETYLVINQPLPNPTGQVQRRFVQMRGVEDPVMSARVHNLSLHPGGVWFSESGLEDEPERSDSKSGEDQKDKPRSTLIQCVLGEGIARVLGRDRTPEQIAQAKNPKRLDVGDIFRAGPQRWKVVGVMQSAGRTLDSEIWAKRSQIGPLFGKANCTTVVLRTKNNEAAAQLRDFFNKEYTKANLAAQVETEYFASLGNTNKQFLYSILVVTVVMSVGGVFGVMNTMFAAISQRIKDVGVLRLLGFSHAQVLVVFLIEAMSIALLGGLIGCAVGFLTDGVSATSIISAGPGGGKSVAVRLTVDAVILTWGMLLSLSMGVVGGLLPALVAVPRRPLDALK
jgi:putative ABC transport system permease protein